MASDETLQLLLQNILDRNENLVKINNEATLAIPKILGILWGISIKLNEDFNILLLCLISIVLLVFWRYFAHYIDDDIAKNYSRILQIEKELKIQKNCSIYPGLIRGIMGHLKNKQLLEEVSDLCSDQRIWLINQLYENKLMGSRGHRFWDGVSYIIICFCVVMIPLTLSCKFESETCEFFCNYVPLFGVILVILIVSIVIFVYYRCIFLKSFQVDSTYEDIENIIKEAKNMSQ